MSCIARLTKASLRSPPGETLVIESAKFSSDGQWPIKSSPIATASLAKWHAIEFDFFLRVDSRDVVLCSADMLSAHTNDGPSIGTPIILNLMENVQLQISYLIKVLLYLTETTKKRILQACSFDVCVSLHACDFLCYAIVLTACRWSEQRICR